MKKYILIENYLIKFLRNEVYKTGLKKALVGLSGGIDSAVVAVLAQKAFGADFEAITLPSASSATSSFDDAQELCNKFGIKNQNISIAPLISAYFKDGKKGNLQMGNFAARMRMSVLYDLSAEQSALVLGTSNKSELLLGYGTIYGDLASALNPIGDMYKSAVFEFARHLDVPASIINKAPSADLWEGQSDEADLGFSYATIDSALHAFVELRLSEDELLERGFDPKLVALITKKIYQNQFKRKMPIIAKLGHRTIGFDFLYPRDIKL